MNPKLLHLLHLLHLLPLLSPAQSSTFSSSNENWNTNGDPANSIPGWLNTGGNPGGYIRGIDAVQGGIWYFTAPQKFLGNKCEAYKQFIRWDQNRNDTTNTLSPGGAPDLLLKGAGITLAWDNPVDPGLNWTHYDVPLLETAGWHIDDNNGAAPTQAEFQAVLNNLYAIQIRGEYRYGSDYGGLDNFTLENNFDFSLDADGSSGAAEGNFNADTSCIPENGIAGLDALLRTSKRIDSIVLTLLYPQNPVLEILESTFAVPNIGLIYNQAGRLTLFNTGIADTTAFLAALQAIRYRDLSPAPPRGVRIVAVRIYTECGDMGVRYAYLAIFPPVGAGPDAVVLHCSYDPPFSLLSLLSGEKPAEAYWLPSTASSDAFFAPGTDVPGAFAYIIPDAGACPGDTAAVEVAIETPFQLRADTTLCAGDTLSLTSPTGWKNHAWNTGGSQPSITVTAPGLYSLQAQSDLCQFSDSVLVNYYQCTPCPWYAPNVFSPGTDGPNARWSIYFACPPLQLRLEIFDRWGKLVFRSDGLSGGWDGRTRGLEAPPGVYVWRAEWESELFGEIIINRTAGDLTVVR